MSKAKDTAAFATRMAALGLGSKKTQIASFANTQANPSLHRQQTEIMVDVDPVAQNAKKAAMQHDQISNISVADLFEAQSDDFYKAKGPKLASDAGALMASLLLLHVPMIAASNVSREAVQNGTPAKTTLSSMLKWPVADWAKASQEIISRRIYANLLPALLTNSFAKDSGLNPVSITALNSFYETFISIAVVSESNARWETALRDAFPLYEKNGVKAKLIDIKTEKDFFDLAKNHNATKDFGRESWLKFEQSRNIQLGNLKAQAFTIFTRNTLTVTAAIHAKTLAAEIADHFKDDIENMGMSGTIATEVLTYAVRAGLAFSTAPIDRILTRLSSGEETLSQVKDHLLHDVKTGEIKSLFRGALPRTVFCTITASSVGEALRLSNFFQNMSDQEWQESLDAMMDKIKMPDVSANMQAMHADINNINWEKIGEDVKKQGTSFYEKASEGTADISSYLNALATTLEMSNKAPESARSPQSPKSAVIPKDAQKADAAIKKEGRF